MALSRSACLCIALLCACSPALDWRQVRPPGIELEALFPCRPASLTREIELLGRRLEMVMHACAAGGSTFAVGSVLLGDLRDVTPALASLRDAAVRNVGAATGPAQAIQVPGMTPNLQAARFVLAGRRPDGSSVVEHLAVFSRGARVYQAMVVGDRPEAEVVTTFLAGLILAS